MPCSSKSVQEHSPPVSLLLNGRSFDQNEEYDEEFNEIVKEAKRKGVKEKRKIRKKSAFDELLAFQKQQIDIQQEQNKHCKRVVWETLEEKRKSDKEEWESDR